VHKPHDHEQAAPDKK